MKVAPSLLKHADDQTALGLAAVLQAMTAAGLAPEALSDWGVIAAPRFLGRLPCAAAMAKFQKMGASSVSPLIIPHLSLHSMSGTISLALKSHGINYGVGGGEGNLSEVVLLGMTTLDEVDLPGVWVVATEWRPEPAPHPDGSRPERSPARCHAIALGLVATAEAATAGLARLVQDAPGREPSPAAATAAPPGVAELVQSIQAPDRSGRTHWRWPATSLGMLELELDQNASACGADTDLEIARAG